MVCLHEFIEGFAPEKFHFCRFFYLKEIFLFYKQAILARFLLKNVKLYELFLYSFAVTARKGGVD